MANFCTNCGAPNDEGTKFCTSCGSMLPEAAPAQQPVQQPAYQQQGYPQQPQYQQPYPTGYNNFTENPKKSHKGVIAAIIIVILLACAAVALFVWPGFLKGGALNGTWVSSDGETVVIDGGKISVDGEEYTCSTSGDKFTMTRGSQSITYTYKLEGDKLTFYLGDDDDPVVTFTKKDSGGKVKSPEEELIGTWELDMGDEDYGIDLGGDMEFKSNGKVSLSVLGMNIDGTYTVSGNNLSITYSVLGTESTTEYTFSISGDTLTLNSDGVTETYKRK